MPFRLSWVILRDSLCTNRPLVIQRLYKAYRLLTSYLAFGLCDFRVPLSSRSRPFLSAVGNYYPILRLTAFFGLQKYSGLNREQDSWRSCFLIVLCLLSGTRISCGTQPGREEPHRCLEMEPGLGECLCGKARKTLRACKSQMRETDVFNQALVVSCAERFSVPLICIYYLLE